jgi:AAA domain-containing protein
VSREAIRDFEAMRSGKVLGEVGRLLSEVEAEQVDWLWRGRIPKGKLTLVDGDPGLGKSALTVDCTARVSVGRRWPDGAPCEVGGVLICTGEDDLADTIRPRLDAAGGDPQKVLALSTVIEDGAERFISIPEDISIIERGIEQVDAEAVFIDPLMAFLSSQHNAHKDQDVRRALTPLAALAESTGAAVVVVRHLNKAAGGNPLYRGGGSIGIVGAARSALLVAKHPEDDERRVLASLKSNLACPAPSLAFELREADNGAVRIEWKGATPHTADVLLSAPVDPEERSALDEAKEFLRDELKDSPVWSNQVKKDAREAGISEMTLKRAKSALGVRSEKEADGTWSWRLPESKGLKGSQASEDDLLDPLEPLPTTASLPASQEDQGDQQAQGDQVRGDERFGTAGNGSSGGRCIHDVPGGCWLCRRN